MPTATWQGVVLADSDETLVVEGNQYFPPEAVNWAFFQDSHKHTVCPWKGQARYYHVVVGEQVNRDAAWSYPNPKAAARHIRNYIAFWRGVRVDQR